jgi:hypothetical protein
MAITYNPDTYTYCYTIRGVTRSGFATKEAAQEALYDEERGLTAAVLNYVSCVSAEEGIISTAAQVAADYDGDLEIADAIDAAVLAAEQRRIEDRIIRLTMEILAERSAVQSIEYEIHSEDGVSWQTWRCNGASIDLMPDGRGSVILFGTLESIQGAAERAELRGLRAILNTPEVVASLEKVYPPTSDADMDDIEDDIVASLSRRKPSA